jgi:hypothetical protein
MRYAPIYAVAAFLSGRSLCDTWSAPARRWETTLRGASELSKRNTCGEASGGCAADECCSEMGFCGKGTDFCKSPQCQIDYSNGNCDAE